MDPLRYQSGFGNQFATEAVPGALPQGRNSPQRAPHGLYAELLSGSAFTAPRAENRRSWMYRRVPSVQVGGFEPLAHATLKTGAAEGQPTPPNPMRWHPTPVPEGRALDFIDGLHTMVVNGDADAQTGMAAHLLLANRSMERVFVNNDGELLVVPQQGAMRFTTELGVLDVAPGEIVLLPRGLAFKVDVFGPTRGLRLRELRRAVPPARAGADRQQRPGQPARLPGAGGRLRGRPAAGGEWCASPAAGCGARWRR
jgi:homogentisate 1,2-dioxygenase